MLKGVILLHHISIEIMGKEFEPHGVIQHLMVAMITTGVLYFAAYGLVIFLKRVIGTKEAESKGLGLYKNG